MIKKYILNILISIDQLFNAITGGDPDETISSRLGKHYRGTWLEKFVDWMFWPNHCEDVAENDEGSNSIIK